jgi:uncharacterized protein
MRQKVSPRTVLLGLTAAFLASAGAALAQTPPNAAQPADAAAADAAATPAAPAAQPECNSLCRVVRTLSGQPTETPAPAVETAAKPEPVRRIRPRLRREAASAKVRPARIGILADPDGTQAATIADLGAVLAPGLPVEALAGKRAAVADLLSRPSADAAIVSSLAVDQAKRSADRLVYVAKLFTQELHAVAKSDVARLDDLAGKPVYVGPKGSDTAAAAEALLAARAVPVAPVRGSFEDAMVAVREGTIAAAFVLAPKPFAPLASIEAAEGLRLVPLDYRTSDDSFHPAALTGADYPGLVRESGRVDTVALDAILIAPRWRESSPRQKELVTFARTLLERAPALTREGRHPKWRDVNAAAEVAGIRRLRAAQDWVQAKLRDNQRLSGPPAAPHSRQRVGEVR